MAVVHVVFILRDCCNNSCGCVYQSVWASVCVSVSVCLLYVRLISIL